MSGREEMEELSHDNNREWLGEQYLKEWSLYSDDLLKNGSMQNVLDRFEDLYSKKGKYREVLLKEKEKIMISWKHGEVDSFVRKLAFSLLYFSFTKSNGLVESESTASKLVENPDGWAKVLLSPEKYNLYMEISQTRETDGATSEQYFKYSMLFELMKSEEHRNLYGYKSIAHIQGLLLDSSPIIKTRDYDAFRSSEEGI